MLWNLKPIVGGLDPRTLSHQHIKLCERCLQIERMKSTAYLFIWIGLWIGVCVNVPDLAMRYFPCTIKYTEIHYNLPMH